MPSRSSTTVGRQRACQAARPSSSAFCCSGVSARGANDVLAVDGEACGLARAGSGSRCGGGSRLGGVRGSRRPRAAAASAERPWSIEKGIFGAAVCAGVGAGACAGVCAEAAETPAAAKSTIAAIVRILTSLQKSANPPLLASRQVLRLRKAGWLPRPQGDASNSSDAGPPRPLRRWSGRGFSRGSRLVRLRPAPAACRNWRPSGAP